MNGKEGGTRINPRAFRDEDVPVPKALTERWERYGLKGLALREDHEAVCDYLDAHPGLVPAFMARTLMYRDVLRMARAEKGGDDGGV